MLGTINHMEFKSLEHIKSEFTLDGETLSELRTELRNKLKEYHPDKIGEENFNKETQKTFHLINEAIEYLDDNREESLVPVSQVTELINIV